MSLLQSDSLKKIINLPLNALGLALVRRNASLVPTWSRRLAHAKTLGFAPKVIVDGGAFKGLWSSEAARIFPGAQLLVVEPNPNLHADIKQNTVSIQPAVKLFPVALGDTPSKGALNIFGDERTDAGASLLDHVANTSRKAIAVEISTLDELCHQAGHAPDLVKLDLQGHELPALQGAANTLKQTEMVIVEFGCLEAYLGRTTPHELLEIMYAHDYCLYDIVDLHYRPYDGALTGGDFFFVKNSSELRAYKGWK